jgi:hydrogenase large subunit
MTRLVIDPVVRAGGPLRVEAEVAGGAVAEAWLSGTMYRGLEHVVRGRQAREAWLLAERVCGACAGIHALASARAVENAVGIVVPRNARILRNMISASTLVQSHVAQFYLRQALDWADPAAAVLADPAATASYAQSMSDWSKSSGDYFSEARSRVAALLASGPFARAYAGHPAYRLPPELSLVVLAHYLEALDWLPTPVRLRTMLGGKSPHPQTYLVGGMALAPEWGGPETRQVGEHPWGAARHAMRALSHDGLAEMQSLIRTTASFVEQVLLPDVAAVAAFYPEWQSLGGGSSHFLSFGEFPLDERPMPPQLMPAGRVMDRDFSIARPFDQSSVAETVAHSWYTYQLGDDGLEHPALAETRPSFSGPALPFSTLDGSVKYSWVKAPRYADDPMEVGPLARQLVAYAAGVTTVQTALGTAVRQLNRGMDGLYSSVGRTLARAVEANLLADRLGGWLDELVANLASGDLAVVDLVGSDQSTWPREASGFGLAESAGGAVGHWVTRRDGRIADYQIVSGSTWNASPRDQRGRPGACERALEGVPLADPQRPLEILRTLHTFDLCPACAVH